MKPEPFATVERGQTAAAPGDTVYIRGGIYAFSGTSRTSGVSFTKSGQPDQRINYYAAPGETPIFDLFDLTPQARVTGLDVNASYIHVRGLEVRGVRQIIVGDSWGVRIRGDGNVIENLNVHDNEAPGIFITSGADNLILNSDSHHNYDPLEDGGNADGFGCHSPGGGNLFSGCRAYENSDDGFDFINADDSCTVEKSWAFRNGWEPETNTAAGNGSGFKCGGYGLEPSDFPPAIPRHVIRFNVAFRNRSQGFYANHHPGGIDFFNNTAFGNGTNFDMLADVGESSHTLRNNVAMDPGGEVSRLSGGTDTFNSWSLPVAVSTDDFQSVDEAEALAPRAADGSLPSMSFLRLAPGSDLIDQGEDVGLPYNDAAPDLGAFESGAPLGGSGGSAGAAAGGTSGGSTASGGVGGGLAGSGGVATAGTGAAGGAFPSTGGAAAGATSGGAAGRRGDPAAADAGCGCRVPSRHGGPNAAVLALALLAAALRRGLRR